MSQVQRLLNIRHVLAIIIGTVIGSGVFINLPIVQKTTGSPMLATIAWLVGGIIWLPQIFILSEMGTAYPSQGFGYLYLRKAGSPFLAFMYVWTVFWTSDTPSITILTVSAVAALEVFQPILANSIWTKLFATLLILIMTFVHYRSVKQGGRLQFVLTVLKISPLIILAIIGLGYIDSPNLFLTPVLEIGSGHWYILILAGISGTVWSYAGFPNVLYMAGEIDEPQRVLPKALIGSTIFVTITYTLVAFATGAIVPHQELISYVGTFANPFKYLPVFSTFAAGFLAIAAFISMIGCANACLMVQPRIEYAIARDGLFFKSFGYLHPKYGTPSNSILYQAGLAIVLVFVGGIENLLGYFTLSYLLQNLFVYGAIFWLKNRDDYDPSYRSPAWRLMAIIAIGIQVALLIGTFLAFPLGGVLAAAGLILTGSPVYLFFKNKQQGDFA